jgi:hypothetical protein
VKSCWRTSIGYSKVDKDVGFPRFRGEVRGCVVGGDLRCLSFLDEFVGLTPLDKSAVLDLVTDFDIRSVDFSSFARSRAALRTNSFLTCVLTNLSDELA